MLKAVRRHTNCPWVLLYIERWLKAPVQLEDGSVVPRMSGTPQLDFGLFMRRERVHFPFGSRYGAEFLYCLGSAGT